MSTLTICILSMIGFILAVLGVVEAALRQSGWLLTFCLLAGFVCCMANFFLFLG